jgi:hypothetical protein
VGGGGGGVLVGPFREAAHQSGEWSTRTSLDPGSREMESAHVEIPTSNNLFWKVIEARRTAYGC